MTLTIGQADGMIAAGATRARERGIAANIAVLEHLRRAARQPDKPSSERRLTPTAAPTIIGERP
jgi:hypothetical protein